MQDIAKAISDGRCALAVSSALLRDPQVVLALADRAALCPMALTGPTPPPVTKLGDQGLARALAHQHGVVIVVDPQAADLVGVQDLAKRLKAGPHKPTIVVVTKKLDFMVQAAFMGLTVEHRKERGQAFLDGLPTPPPASEAPIPDLPKPAAAKGQAGLEAPGPLCVGRDEELARLAEILGQGGPVVVSGPPGIGRRTLAEHAIGATELVRQPDVALDRDVGFDTLAGRLATLLDGAGQSAAKDALVAQKPPAEIIDAIVGGLKAAESLADHVLVVRHLEVASGADGAFFRKSRLEMLCEALLIASYPLRLVFLSTAQPVFYREGRGTELHRLELGGLAGKHYHEVFEALHAPEFPRERFGPLSERLHGHPLAVKMAAVGMRRHPELVDDDKAFGIKAADDVSGVRKQVDKRLKALPGGLQKALATAAHLRDAATGRLLADLGVSRKQRDALILEGLLAVVGGDGKPRRYFVPEVVTRTLSRRDVADFDTMRRVADALRKRADDADGVVAFALRQEANRNLVQARGRDVADLGLPDADALLDNVAGMLRNKTQPRPDLAQQRLKPVLEHDPANSDAWLLELERLRNTDAPNKERKAAVETALAKAPVPELFHEAVGFLRGQGAVHEAIALLEQGVQALPDHSRLRCRLASLQYRQGRRHDAIQHLEAAMAADPMLPDAYGLLGTIRAEEGALSVEKAEDLLREAVRLAPGDVVQTARLIRLLLDIAAGVPARREAVRAEILELLEGLRQSHKDDWEVHLLYAEALRAQGEDPEKAAWFLDKARKLAPKRRGLAKRFRIESARLDIARGRVDEAERALKEMARKDPSNADIVQLLAEIHIARGHLVAAHAELSRAIDRMSPHALDRSRAEARLADLAAQIQAAAGVAPSTPSPEAPAPEAEPEAPHVTPTEAESSPAEEPAAPVESAEDSTPSAPIAEEAPATPADPAGPDSSKTVETEGDPSDPEPSAG